jgi:hypothetical protein
LLQVVLPDENNCWVKFKSTQKMLPVPFVIYADFESYTCKLQGPQKATCSTIKYEQHTPSGYAYHIVSSDASRVYTPVVYRGPNVVEEFLKKMNEESEKITDILSHPVPIQMTSEDQIDFNQAVDCYLCDTPLGADKVRDHDHLTGVYRGAAHSECNLQLSYRGDKWNSKFFIPVVFHNLRGYDGHLILKGFRQNIFNKSPRISCIPTNMEKYLSFSINNLRFIDSLQFLNSSLEKLTNNLRNEDFKQTKSFWPSDKVHLLLRKGVYPYEYMDAPEKMEELQLPPSDAFFSRLTGQHVSIDDYQHAEKVWKEFKMANMGEYHDTYLLTDVLILADVFENFRSICLANYKLDPLHYYSSPGLAWDAMLKKTGVRLELMQDREMHDIIDKSIRGGISCISHKHAVANNPHIPESYNAALPSSYIMYLDANNLYGCAMSQPLPEKEFDFLLEEQIESFDFMSVPDDAPEGYILEVRN